MYFYTHVHVRRDTIYLKGYSNGRRIQETVEWQPYLFERTGKPSEFKTLDGITVEKIKFDTISAAKDYVNRFKDTAGKNIYGLTNFPYVFLNEEFSGEVEYDQSLISVVSLDIETDSRDGFPNIETADKEITAITISKNGKRMVFGQKYYKSKSDDVVYVLCKDEKDLLNKFLIAWTHDNWKPDVVTGWNIELFDIPYLYGRIKLVLGEKSAKMLSPWGVVYDREIVRGKSSSNPSKTLEGRVEKVYDMVGISVLDYLQLYKKFSFTNQESYKLDHIASMELGEKKIDYSEYGSLADLYDKNFELFIDYNIHDVVLVDKLEEKLGLIKQVFALAYDAKVNFNDVMTTVRPWDVIIHNYLMSKKVVIPQFTPDHSDFELVGGYVKDPQIGMHKWVVSFDLNSLYPHLIMQYNISPETFLERLHHFPSIDDLLNKSSDYEYSDTWSYAANGCAYRKDKQGFLPELMQKMYDDRAKYKQLMIEAKKRYEVSKSKKDENDIARYHNLQMAKKIQLNSAYGALGNQYFRWFNFDHAEAITKSGQLSIRWIEKAMNSYLNKLVGSKDFDYVIASDTDSIYINMEPLVKKIFPDGGEDPVIVDALDKFIEAKIQPYMDKTYQDLADYMNAYQQKMKMKRESIANKGIWIAKKMYMLNVWDNEGVRYTDPKLKVMGIASVRSSTPSAVRAALKKSITLIMNTDEDTLIKYIDKFKAEFLDLPFEQVAFPRGIKNMKRYRDSSSIYKKGTPIQVKGALLYNKLVENNKKYQSIVDGDKIKFAYLKVPNPLHDTVIAVPDEMPDEFNLDKYIDRDMQFDKSFLEPLKSILDVIGWNTEHRSTLDSFFG